MLIEYIMQSKRFITAPKSNAIIPLDIFGKPFVCGALSFNVMHKEIWKPIKGFTDYFISNYGNIYKI